MTLFWPCLLLAWQLDCALAWLDGWQFAPARPRLEPELRARQRARRPA